ncbi:GLPGLI family protein [Parapedobacter luteus]|uniref:GLPGLI family protein n=1 Tax=Parapedobacter luteus TaxID=623280 RepID=A0A1T4ZUH4_9SPHI|nr:GLPGLI family protein [Parapedobacter luteus]SKB26411.1 GLPGLI family protein [Parapedobacter luteus]
MKSKLLIIISLVHLFFFTAAAQNHEGYKIYYDMSFRKDSTSSLTTTELTELLVNGRKSLFRTVLQAEQDTALFYQSLQRRSEQAISTNARYRILKDYSDQKTHYYEQVETLGGVICTYVESQDSMIWSLTNDTATINKFLCQKALLTFGKRTWEAWFCPDIPISDGPYKFCGLPGLIVRIRDRTDSWLFDLKRIEHVPAFIVDLTFLHSAEVVNKLELYKRKWNYRYNWLQINQAAGNIGPVDEEMRQHTKNFFEK